MSATQIIKSLAILNSQLKLDRLIPAALDFSLEVTSADRALLMLYDAEGKLKIRAARNRHKQNLPEQEFAASESIIRKATARRLPLYVPRLQEAAEFAESASIYKMKLQSTICIPLFKSGNPEGDLAGVLYIDSSSKGNSLGEEQLQLMQAVANYVAISIENATLFEQLEQKNEQIAQLNLQLQSRVEFQEENLTEMKILLAEKQRELGHVYGLGNLIGRSKAMQEVFKILEKVTSTQATVLITGESGTGKELVAKYIHHNGVRAEKPIVSINCSAFNETLLESELFGHRKGAFTGATEHKLGLFQLADGGTLFMDEVGDMSLDMQKKLLRVLENGEVRPIGSTDSVRVDVRIVAATNRNLKEMIRQEKFREDLYFRLNVIHIHLPPLRERTEDIPLLIQHYWKEISAELKKDLPSVEDEVMKKFLEYDWPGNVRELKNQLHRYFILGSDYPLNQLQSSKVDNGLSITSVEKKAILRALEVTLGNKKKAAELLGIPRRSFYDKLHKYNIS